MQSGFHALNQLSVTSAALFLDFDGTLARLADHPEDVRLDKSALDELAKLYCGLGGALAIVTGRDIATLDQFLAPHKFPASGVHGFETRMHDGHIQRIAANTQALLRLEQVLTRYAGLHAGLLLEGKPASLALHYRQRPDLGAACEQVVQEAVDGEAGLRVIHGKMVVEVKAHGGDKGQAVATFLETAPYKARMPVFIGDDRTDEAAFAVVNARSGISIKVGFGESSAQYRLADPGEVHKWLIRFSMGSSQIDAAEGMAP